MLKRFWRGLLGGGLLILFAGCSSTPGAGGASNPGTITSGQVTIATDHTIYAPAEDIHVTVTNHLSEDIYALDTQASCTILGLEQQINGAWQGSNASRCLMGRRAQPLKIGSGQTYIATIRPGAPGVANAAFPTGTYRMVLIYSDSQAGLGMHSSTTTIYSAALMVAGQAPGITPPPTGEPPSGGTPTSIQPRESRPGP